MFMVLLKQVSKWIYRGGNNGYKEWLYQDSVSTEQKELFKYIAKKKKVSMSEFMVVATGGKIFKGAREIRK